MNQQMRSKLDLIGSRLNLMQLILQNGMRQELCMEQVGLFVADMIAFQLLSVTKTVYFGESIPTLLKRVDNVGSNWFVLPSTVKLEPMFYEQARMGCLTFVDNPQRHILMCNEWYHNTTKMLNNK